MRKIPMLTALTVLAVLYLMVMQRDLVMAVAGAEPPAPKPPAEPRAGAQIPVVALQSQAQTVREALRVRGQTEAARSVEIRAETAGQVISEPLRKGSFVKAGDPLCRLDPGTRDARLAEAEANVSGARATLAEARINDIAARELSKEGFASQTRIAATAAALERAQAALRSAEAAMAAARREVENLTIAAPFDGLLETDAAELGSLMQNGGLCATLIQLDPVRLVGYVPETEVAKVETGAFVAARLSTGDEVTGRIGFIGRSADPVTRTFRVEAEIPNPDLTLRDGQTVEMTISAPGQTAHLLPQSALTIDDDGRMGVRLVRGGLARFAPVRILHDTAEGIWLSGLPDSVQVIVVGQEFVTDGVPVSVSLREAAR
ncbi:multidrug efflux system membrane fusion protein [Rhodovulum imhoffii]|uniref:Multidrug efflux system membrane fusion protein n=1 Tax=Rhodovulum imhoffii TaxID=365340 RepID=A0A2T5BQ13_9RHOB|nr:efflux RND transporter periplasmic adaptor subunit [Rhodovulum imhoffii]MBK5933096.1 efflux transporter periplasmic adaptor subunit [Rhodovulum imhoffii]PTN01153.1 multidrug efflux system membrane fusion protein [Rhodovulum imhoffii]